MPKGSFYHYFKSKEQFGSALLEDYFAKYRLHLAALFANDKTAVQKLLHFFQYWIDSQTSDTVAESCLVVKLGAEVTDLSENMRLILKNGTDNVVKRTQ